MVYIPRKEMDSSSTSFRIFTDWVKENGWFRVLKSDSDPAYASRFVSVLLKLVGVDGSITYVHSSLGSHSKYVERSNVLIRKVLKQAEKYDDLTCARDLEVFTASAPTPTHLGITGGFATPPQVITEAWSTPPQGTPF